MTVRQRLLPVDSIERVIFFARGHNAILDSELAALYGVETRRVNEQVKRNPSRFPADFAFQLTQDEYAALRSQDAILKGGRGEHRKYLPWAFTEHGALMAANVLNSPRAIQMSVYVVRAFLRLRKWVAGEAELVAKLAELERRVAGHDQDLRAIVQSIRRSMAPPETPRRRIASGAATRASTWGMPSALPSTSCLRSRRRSSGT